MKVLLVIPPFTQINTPYPAPMQLAGFLISKGYEAESFDLSLETTLRIFSKEGLRKIFDAVEPEQELDEYGRGIMANRNRYEEIIESVVELLQGRSRIPAEIFTSKKFLPRGESFENLDRQKNIISKLKPDDKAKHLCSLVIDDLSKFIRKNITPHFGLSRYAESIAVTPPEFDPLLSELNREPNIIEQMIIDETQKIIELRNPDVVGFTIPFPGNLLGALIHAKFIKHNYPEIKVVFGGGYINTELRQLKDPRIFDFCDYITYDDGEMPLLNILRNLERRMQNEEFVRTLMKEGNELIFKDNGAVKNISHAKLCSPSLKGIEPGKYISMLELLNPMHRLWSDGYWNKLTIAHGCYWRKCTFCDITLDYISSYSPANAVRVVDWMEDLISQTGSTNFHFTDEAAPPALLKEISVEILKRKLAVRWWGNIRFEKSFTRDLCKLMAAAGCVAVSGGIEVADDRLLKLINKGVTIEQAVKSCANFKNAGIMVHAYLMYGFPTQTELETINSLEIVRQFMKYGLFQSAYWHLFTLTVHSPIAKEPAKYKINIDSQLDCHFANNNLGHNEIEKTNHKKFGGGLNKALYNYMHQAGLDWDIQTWFDFTVPKTTLKKNHVKNILEEEKNRMYKDCLISVWLGNKPELTENENGSIEICVRNDSVEGNWECSKSIAGWLNENILQTIDGSGTDRIKYLHWRETFPGTTDEFENFLNSDVWKELREHFLLFV